MAEVSFMFMAAGHAFAEGASARALATSGEGRLCYCMTVMTAVTAVTAVTTMTTDPIATDVGQPQSTTTIST